MRGGVEKKEAVGWGQVKTSRMQLGRVGQMVSNKITQHWVAVAAWRAVSPASSHDELGWVGLGWEVRCGGGGWACLPIASQAGGPDRELPVARRTRACAG